MTTFPRRLVLRALLASALLVAPTAAAPARADEIPGGRAHRTPAIELAQSGRDQG